MMEFGKFSLQTHEGGAGCIKGLNAVERREGERWSESEKQRENESVGARISRSAR